MQDILLDDQNISPTPLKAEILELQVLCKALVAQNQELVAKNQELIAQNQALVAKNEEYAGMILALREQVQLLKDEIAVLKGQKPKPKIPPNRLNDNPPGASGSDKDGKGKRPGSDKRSKTGNLEINQIRQIDEINFESGLLQHFIGNNPINSG